MLPQIDGLSLSPVKVFSIYIFHLLIHLNRAESQVVGPHQPVVALVDDDVILPCHVEPAEDVTAQILEWTRSDLNPRFVHVWRSGQDLVNTRNPSYRGRASLFINELKRGNISLKLSRVKLSDEGTYECSIPLMGKKYFVKLVVASDAATSPVISLSGIDKNRAGVVLQCESAGWYPEPELLWLDGEGNLLSAGPTETLRGPDDLYTVSSRVTVEKRHSNNITCRVQQRKISQSRETHIRVPEDFFDIPSSSSSVTIGLAVSLALCIILLILSAVVLLRGKRKRMMNTNRRTRGHPGGEDAEVLLMTTETEKQNTSSSSTKTKKQTSYLQSEKTTEITNQLKEVKEAAEKLKKQLESKNQQLEKELQDEKNRNEKEEAKLKTQTINSEMDEFIQSFLTLESKISESISQQTELCETISRAQEEKQKMESEMKTLKNDLDSTKQQLEKKTETINQLLQEKQAAEKLKNQFKSKCHEMINSEKDEIIQKLTETCPALDSKLQSEKITENINQQLQQLKETTATLKDQMEKNSHEMITSEMELDKFIQKVLQTFPTLESKWETNTDISKKLQDVKQAAEHLKAELEFRSHEMIKSEREKDEIIQKLMKTFPTLDSKWKKNNETINQLVQVKKKAEDLKKQLKPQTHESKEKTETIDQLQQLEQAAETLKIQLESKNQQMIKSEREKDEIIQKLMEIFPTLESKLQWKKNTEIIYQLQEVKETAEKLEQLEKKNQGKTDSEIIKQLQQDKKTAEKVDQLQFQGKTDSEIIKQLQQDKKTAEKLKQLQVQGKTDSKIIDQLQEVKDTTEKLKKQLESKNWEMLWAEKMRNEETDRKLKELVKQLEEKKKKTEETLNELEKTSKEEDMENAPVGYKDQRRSQQTGDDVERIARGSGGFPSQHLHTTDKTKGRASNDGQVGPLLPNQQHMNKPQKGDIILEEVNENYCYICLRNTSSEDKLMTGWELKLIKDRKLFTYKFQEIITLKAGERLTLQRFTKARSPYPDNTHLWKDMPSWNSGDKVKIILISNTKEEHQLM